MNRARKPVRIVPKGWGREVWIANGDLYCGKILEIRKGKRCSLHYHKLKTESFYLRSGKLLVRVKESPESETIEEFELVPANAWTSRLAWCIRWKRSRMPSCSSFRPSTSTATRIGWSPAIESERGPQGPSAGAAKCKDGAQFVCPEGLLLALRAV